MMLVELALRGISGFPETARLRLRPGVNVVRTSNRKLRRTIIDATFHTLYPDGMRASATSELVDRAQRDGDARIALTIYGRDRATYRLLRQAEFGAMELHRLDPATKRFVGMSSLAQEIAQYLRVQQQLPDDVTFERLFVLDRDAMPSQGTRARFRSQLGELMAMRASEASWAPSGPGLPAMAPSFPGVRNAWVEDEDLVAAPAPRVSSVAGHPRSGGGEPRSGGGEPPSGEGEPAGGAGDGQDQASELREVDLAERKALAAQLTDARSYEAAQARLDHLQKRQAMLETKFERFHEAEASLRALQQEVEECTPLLDIGAPVIARLQRFDEARAKHEEDRARLQGEIDELVAADRLVPEARLYRDRYFLGGTIGAAFAVGLGVLLGRPAVALFNIPCALVAAGGALRWVSELEAKVRSGIRVRAATERIERQTQQFELEASATAKLLEKYGAESASAFLARIDRAHEVEALLASAKSQFERMAADAEFQSAREELEQIRPQIEACEAILMSAGPMVSVATLEARVARVSGHDARGEADEALRPSTAGAAGFADAADFSEDGDDGEEDGYGSGYGTSEGGWSSDAKDNAKVSSSPIGSGSVGGAEVRVWAASSGGHSRGQSGRFGVGVGVGVGRFGSQVAGVGGYGSGGFGAAAATGPANRSVDLMQSGVDMTQKDEDALAEALGPRLNAYVSAFSDGRWTSVSFAARGALHLRTPGDDALTDYLSLEREDLDLVDAALRLSLLDLCVQSVVAPVIVDDPFEDLDAEKRMTFVQALAELGRATQVIVCTGRDDIAGAQVLDPKDDGTAAPA
ncbi:MAG: hypothetical protein IPK13_23250 [Deltaproteobacteria bacterium]|nr:hypothetical protein [Deltaproteobacteria bacterium]